MSQCPCCSHTLLKHWKRNQIYWYCAACRQEMPNLELVKISDDRHFIRSLSDRLSIKVAPDLDRIKAS